MSSFSYIMMQEMLDITFFGVMAVSKAVYSVL